MTVANGTPSRPGPFVLAPRPRRRRHRAVALLYVRAILAEFRWTLAILAAAVVIGTAIHALTPQQSLGGRRPSLGVSVYSAWMALFAQPTYSPPIAAHLMVLYAVYPVLGFILVGNGVVRLSLLMISKRRGEREWMLVMASTYRDHVVLCGLGHLGIRVLEQLVAGGTPVVVLERAKTNPFVIHAKAMDVPVLIRDMKEDQALIDAGIEHANAIIICSNDDVSNLEVAIDSRRMNPRVRIVMRLFDQQLASKIAGALTVDAAFSSSSLAAPVVAALSLHSKVLSSIVIRGQTFVAAEVPVEAGSTLSGKRCEDVEGDFAARVLAVLPADGGLPDRASQDRTLAPGETVVIHVAADNLSAIAAAGCGSRK